MARGTAMAKGPQPISTILAELMARRGFTRVRSCAALEGAWRDAVGVWAAGHTRVGTIRRGKLEVIVANSTLVQELSFQREAILESLAKALPDETIQDLRFRVGAIN